MEHPKINWVELKTRGKHIMYSSSTVVRGTDQTSASEKALQQQKYEEIVGVLLSAGYFRARVASLTPFDKVWGLHWAVCFHCTFRALCELH